MEATALICNEQQQFSLETVVLPDLAADQIQIRTQYSGVSIGTEFALIRNKISWGPYPLCTGYMGSGLVEAVGDEVTGFAVGDAVYYRRNDAMSFPDGGAISAVTGAHCSHAILKPDTSHGADHVAPGAGMDVAAMFVMPAVGLNGVDMANPRMGQTVAVHGVGLIGLGVVAALVHRGCRVIAIDVNPRQLALARELGADEIINSQTEDLTERFAELAPGGADVVFEATGIPACIDVAVPLAKTLGRLSQVSIFPGSAARAMKI